MKKVNYSAYLSAVNHSNSVENKVDSFKLRASNQCEVRFASVHETPKYSTDNSIENDDYKSVYTNKLSDIDKLDHNFVALNSPNSAKVTESRVYKSKPTVVSYSINALKNDFKKTHNKYLAKQKELESKRKKLEQKVSGLKQCYRYDMQPM